MSVNGVQSLRIEKGTIEFKKYFKQIPVLFKILSYEGSYWKKYHNHSPCSFTNKFVCVDNNFTKTIAVFTGESAAYEFIDAVLKEYEYCQKVMKK